MKTQTAEGTRPGPWAPPAQLLDRTLPPEAAAQSSTTTCWKMSRGQALAAPQTVALGAFRPADLIAMTARPHPARPPVGSVAPATAAWARWKCRPNWLPNPLTPGICQERMT
jgi:hypothetical protein